MIINIRKKVTFVHVIFRRMHNTNVGYAKFMRLCGVASKTELTCESLYVFLLREHVTVRNFEVISDKL